MSDNQRKTAWFIVVSSLAWAASLIGYDLWIYQRDNAATISQVMYRMGQQWPAWVVLWVAPFAALAAHFWWPQDIDDGRAAGTDGVEKDREDINT